MSDQFDPYYTWLGIPPAEQPPHHYRLLGIQLFEPNSDVIAHAADRLMMHLRSFQHGTNSALSQRLLNEVAAARICLQDASRKAAYDAHLRHLTTPAAPPILAPPNSPVPTASLAMAGRGTPRVPRPGTIPFKVATIAVGCIAGLFIAVMALQYATGVDLLGWSTPKKKGKEPAPKVVSQRPQNPAEIKGGQPAVKPGMPVAAAPMPSKETAPAPQVPPTPPSTVKDAPSRDSYVFPGPELPKRASIKIVLNKVHRNGLVTLEEEPPPATGAWRIENQELLLTSIHGMKNTSLAVSSSREDVREIRVTARTIAGAKSSVRFACGNVYVILNWEDQNENHILIGGRRNAATSPHCLVPGKWHEIALVQAADVVRVLVDGKEVISAKDGKLAKDVQIGSSNQGTIGVRSVEIVPDSRVAATGGLLGRFDIRYSNETRRDYLFEKGGRVTCLGGVYKSEVKPIPPLPIPMKARVFWHEEEGNAVGWIPWPDTKVERVVVDHEIAGFILFPSDGSLTGEAHATAPTDMSTAAAMVGRFEILYSNATRRDYLFERGGAVTFLGEASPGQSGQIPPLSKPIKSTVSWHQDDGHLAGYIFWSSYPKVECVVVNDDGRMKFTLFSDVGYVTGETPKSAP